MFEDHEHARYPSLWAELAQVGLAMLGLCGVFCMAAGMVLGMALIVEKVAVWL